MATSAAISEWRRVYSNPGDALAATAFVNRAGYYDLLWAYYNNRVFERVSTIDGQWARYKGIYGLYRYVRSLYNPMRRLVNFYAGAVYPGVLSEDGGALPDGEPMAIPLADDTPKALKTAVAQIWQWSNWQAGKSVLVRYGAVTGNALVEVADSTERAKVTLDIIWPGLVSDLTLDRAGNVKAYALEYQVQAEDGYSTYAFRKTVDDESIRTYRNGNVVTEDDNPYGFVPAVWAKHSDMGGDYGAGVMEGSIGKVDELNSLASHVHDQIHKVIEGAAIAWGGKGIENAFGNTKRPATDQLTTPGADRESILLFTGPKDGKLESLLGNLDLTQAGEHLDRLLHEIEADHPELTMYTTLRGMSQVSGPGAERLMGDVRNMVIEAQAGYDQQSIKLFQMAVAIAGWRASRGDWGRSLTRAQEKFRPFDLDSYAAGDLDMTIMPRKLIAPTGLEQAQEEDAWALAMGHWADAGGDVAGFLEMQRGFTKKQIALYEGPEEKTTPIAPTQGFGAVQPTSPGQPGQEGQQGQTPQPGTLTNDAASIQARLAATGNGGV